MCHDCTCKGSMFPSRAPFDLPWRRGRQAEKEANTVRGPRGARLKRAGPMTEMARSCFPQGRCCCSVCRPVVARHTEDLHTLLVPTSVPNQRRRNQPRCGTKLRVSRAIRATRGADDEASRPMARGRRAPSCRSPAPPPWRHPTSGRPGRTATRARCACVPAARLATPATAEQRPSGAPGRPEGGPSGTRAAPSDQSTRARRSSGQARQHIRSNGARFVRRGAWGAAPRHQQANRSGRPSPPKRTKMVRKR